MNAEHLMHLPLSRYDKTGNELDEHATTFPSGKWCVLSLLTALLAICQAVVAGAQMNTGQISGVLRDRTDALISGGTVTATHLKTHQSWVTASGRSGQYLFVQLPLGDYSVAAEARGFTKTIRQAVVLNGGSDIRSDFSMELGPENVTIVVETAPALMQVDSAAIKDVLEHERVVGLPLKDRQFLSLALLSPGVVNPPGGTRGDSLQQTGKLINVLGNRTGHNLFLVDGVSVTDEYYNNVSTNVSPDATREINFQLTDYSAEFGGKSGGMINVITQAGTDQYHGSFYEFFRNSATDARNYFTPTGVAPPLHGSQFGAAIGGPIVKSKTFFFTSYEGQRLTQTLSQLFSVPTISQRAGNLAGLAAIVDPVTKAPVAGNDLRNDPNFSTANPSSAAAVALLNLLPPPNLAGNTNNLRSLGRQTIDIDNYSARLDHQISPNDLLFLRASYFAPTEADPFGSTVLNEALLPGFGRILRSPAMSLAAGETHTFTSHLVNELRLGWLTVSGGQKDPNAGNPFASVNGLQGTTTVASDAGFPQFNLSGQFSTVGTATGFSSRLDHNFELFDNVSFQRGKQQLTFGGYFFHLAFQPKYPNNARGTYTYNGSYSGNALADLLFGDPSQAQVGIGEGAENAHTNWAHFYVQDNWQITPRLKAEIGLRYEFNGNLAAQANQTSDVDLSTGTARFVVAGDPNNFPGLATTLAAYAAAQNPSLAIVSNSEARWASSLLTERAVRLSPRVGIAWTPSWDEHTVFRGGFGVFTNQAAYSVLQNLAENIPFFLNKTVNNTPGTPPYSTADILTRNPNGAIGANGVNHDFKIEYNEVWNTSLERSLSPTSTFSLKYVGSRTVHADSSTAVNLPSPGTGGVQGRRPFGNLNSFTTIRWDGWASFHGLTFELATRKFHGLDLDASYTWSHSIDDASDAGATNAEFNLPQDIRANNVAVEKADSSFDHRNRFVGNLMYDIHFVRPSQRWARTIANGWQFGGIFIAQSGAPFTINLGPANDVANIGLVNGNNIQRPNTSGDPNAGTRSAKQWFNTAVFSLPAPYTFGNTPRNSVIGPDYIDFDASLRKSFSVRESIHLTLSAEAYNLPNRTNFTLPGRIFEATNFGVVSSALEPRQMQFSAKLSF